MVGPEELRTGYANFSLACDADDEIFLTEVFSSIGLLQNVLVKLELLPS